MISSVRVSSSQGVKCSQTQEQKLIYCNSPVLKCGNCTIFSFCMVFLEITRFLPKVTMLTYCTASMEEQHCQSRTESVLGLQSATSFSLLNIGGDVLYQQPFLCTYWTYNKVLLRYLTDQKASIIRSSFVGVHILQVMSNHLVVWDYLSVDRDKSPLN